MQVSHQRSPVGVQIANLDSRNELWARHYKEVQIEEEPELFK